MGTQRVGLQTCNTRAAKLSVLNLLSLFRDLQKKPTRFGGGRVVGELFNRRDSVGGGVVGEFVRDPQKLTRFSVGGGVVAGIFSYLQLRNLIFNPHSVIFVGRDTHFF